MITNHLRTEIWTLVCLTTKPKLLVMIHHDNLNLYWFLIYKDNVKNKFYVILLLSQSCQYEGVMFRSTQRTKAHSSLKQSALKSIPTYVLMKFLFLPHMHKKSNSYFFSIHQTIETIKLCGYLIPTFLFFFSFFLI